MQGHNWIRRNSQVDWEQGGEFQRVYTEKDKELPNSERTCRGEATGNGPETDSWGEKRGGWVIVERLRKKALAYATQNGTVTQLRERLRKGTVQLRSYENVFCTEKTIPQTRN